MPSTPYQVRPEAYPLAMTPLTPTRAQRGENRDKKENTESKTQNTNKQQNPPPALTGTRGEDTASSMRTPTTLGQRSSKRWQSWLRLLCDIVPATDTKGRESSLHPDN